MLYLDSLVSSSGTETAHRYAICHEKVPNMPNIVELAPSETLLDRWQSGAIGWEEFRQHFTEEMRAEYLKGDKSRLKGLAQYSLENDVTLYSPEPPGEQTYRAILGGIVSGIIKQRGVTEGVIDLARESTAEAHLTEQSIQKMAEIAADCEFFAAPSDALRQRSCQICEHLDKQIYVCSKLKKVVIEYEWAEPVWNGNQG